MDSVLRRMPAAGMARTTVELSTQRLLERLLRGYVERRSVVGIRNAATLLLDWRSMEVKALVGSANFADTSIQGQVNGVEARRSPGSALKPFIYALAFDQGLIHPHSLLKDAPTSFGGYNPENFDRDFAGPIDASEALVRSRNIPAVQLASQLNPSLHSFLRSAGISRLKDEKTYGLSLVLGSAEVTAVELVELYAMLANGGVLRPTKLETGAEDSTGSRLLSAPAAYLTLEALSSRSTAGTAVFRQEWLRDGLDVAWKTGTSYAHRDAWSVGVAGPYVIAVWVGNFDGQPNPAFVGNEAAAPLMFEMLDALRGKDPALARSFRSEPRGVSHVRVCSLSGLLPGAHCPHQKQTLFIPGVSPTKTCDVHRELLVNAQNGRRACREGLHTRREVFEFWSSDLLKLFRKAGLPRRLPPQAEGDCAGPSVAASGNPPSITSPAQSVEYALRGHAAEPETVPLSATVDADARELFWFVDERLVGRSRAGEPLQWPARPGRYTVRVVDDHGRSDVRELAVKQLR